MYILLTSLPKPPLSHSDYWYNIYGNRCSKFNNDAPLPWTLFRFALGEQFFPSSPVPCIYIVNLNRASFVSLSDLTGVKREDLHGSDTAERHQSVFPGLAFLSSPRSMCWVNLQVFDSSSLCWTVLTSFDWHPLPPFPGNNFTFFHQEDRVVHALNSIIISRSVF